MDNFEKAIKSSKELSSYEGSDHRVINHHSDFLNGSLYVVGFVNPENEKKHNYVYIEGKDVTVYKNEAILNEMVARKSTSKFTSFMDGMGGIAGIIGLIITFTIVFMLLNNPEAKIPQVLSAALSTILGFYFGSKSSK